MEANKDCLRSHVCQFPCDLGNSLFLLPWCVIYYFSRSGTAAGKKILFCRKLRLKKKTRKRILVLQKMWCVPQGLRGLFDLVFGSQNALAFGSYCKLHTRYKKAHFVPLVHNILFCGLGLHDGQN